MLTRRSVLKYTAAASLCGPQFALGNAPKLIRRRIGTGKDSVPAIGMGSWLTFDVGDSAHARGKRVEILARFFDMGGTVIDSSPMYGTSQVVIGHCLKTLANDKDREPPTVFGATKVWTPGRFFGVRQMKNSAVLWGVDRFDLMQVHNLLDWKTHLETLKAWKAEGKVRYIGVTTSQGRRHETLERIMLEEPIDFVQLTYNILDRRAERRLLPLAAERGIAVIANRPFRRGGLFQYFAHQPLPDWAAEIDCANWAQFFLKFIVSHPAVTCAIPATSRVDHMQENMGALVGRQPDEKTRRRMIEYVEWL